MVITHRVCTFIFRIPLVLVVVFFCYSLAILLHFLSSVKPADKINVKKMSCEVGVDFVAQILPTSHQGTIILPWFTHFCTPGIHKSATKKEILVKKLHQFLAKITFASQKCTETSTTTHFVVKFETKWCISHFSATFLRHRSKIVLKVARIPGGTGLWGAQKCANCGVHFWCCHPKRHSTLQNHLCFVEWRGSWKVPHVTQWSPLLGASKWSLQCQWEFDNIQLPQWIALKNCVIANISTALWAALQQTLSIVPLWMRTFLGQVKHFFFFFDFWSFFCSEQMIFFLWSWATFAFVQGWSVRIQKNTEQFLFLLLLMVQSRTVAIDWLLLWAFLNQCFKTVCHSIGLLSQCMSNSVRSCCQWDHVVSGVALCKRKKWSQRSRTWQAVMRITALQCPMRGVTFDSLF